MRIVADTNLLIASLFWDRAPSIIVTKALQGEIQIIISPGILAELRNVLQNPKEKFKLGEQETDDVIHSILGLSQIIKPLMDVKVSRDPTDDHILACAQSANADMIITSDKDLLVLKNFQGIPIKKPEEFLADYND